MRLDVYNKLLQMQASRRSILKGAAGAGAVLATLRVGFATLVVVLVVVVAAAGRRAAKLSQKSVVTFTQLSSSTSSDEECYRHLRLPMHHYVAPMLVV